MASDCISYSFYQILYYPTILILLSMSNLHYFGRHFIFKLSGYTKPHRTFLLTFSDNEHTFKTNLFL